jgi:hypothetical protein
MQQMSIILAELENSAYKLGKPRLEAVHMHTFRYWKGTMPCHFKPDILYVAESLGYKSIENTRSMTQLEKILFKNYQTIIP